MSEPKTIEAVRKVLKEPFAGDLTESAQKIRRTLFVFSLSALLVVHFGIKVNPESSILGLRFDGLTDDLIRQGLLLTVGYLWLHFLWCVIESFAEWRLRLTGTRVAHKTVGVFSSEAGDYPDDPRQSTLYNWWADSIESGQSLREGFETAKTKFEELRQIIAAGGDSGVVQSEFHRRINDLGSQVTRLKHDVDALAKVLESNRIPVSLERFDGWWRWMLRSQSMRWIIVDATLPLIVGATAIGYLMLDLLTKP